MLVGESLEGIVLKVFGNSVEWQVPARVAGRQADLERLTPPSESMENWRYSPIEEVKISRYANLSKPLDRGRARALLEGLNVLSGMDRVVVVSGGSVIDVPEDLPVAESGDQEVLREQEEPYLELACLMAPAKPIVSVDKPGKLALVVIDADSDAFRPDWITVRVGAGVSAEITVLEIARGSLLIDRILEFDLAKESKVIAHHYVEADKHATQLVHMRANISQEASFDLHHVMGSFGHYRLRTDINMAGIGSSLKIRAGYVVGSSETVELRTFVSHDAPRTTSDLLYKGAVSGSGTAIYTGLITIMPTGTGSQAFQTNRNLLLSRQARAESVPNLDIQTSDVRCSHASTVGPVDEEQLFYLQSKGIPRASALKVLARAFFAAISDFGNDELDSLTMALDRKWDE
jgi:Fe-S cluster assembly protein SufD